LSLAKRTEYACGPRPGDQRNDSAAPPLMTAQSGAPGG